MASFDDKSVEKLIDLIHAQPVLCDARTKNTKIGNSLPIYVVLSQKNLTNVQKTRSQRRLDLLVTSQT